jgi:hypothetical protein
VCFSGEYLGCQYTATVRSAALGVTNSATATAVFDISTIGYVYNPYAYLHSNGTTYIYLNTEAFSYSCQDDQTLNLTTSRGGIFAGNCPNDPTLTGLIPVPLTNGPLTISGTATDARGNIQNINLQYEVCHDPIFVPPYRGGEGAVFFNFFGGITASAQVVDPVPSCPPPVSSSSVISSSVLSSSQVSSLES